VGVPDSEVLRIAAESGRILVSHDRNTMPAHFADFLELQSSPGVIIVSQDLDIGAAIEDLLLIWAATEAEEWVDQLGFVPT
jgi:predicted nuclease of predicted toxin-antitoxin system